MEFAFELALCSHLETATDWLVARQLGAGVDNPGQRVVDVVAVEPGPAFEGRTRITPESIPPRAVESDVGAGRAVYWKDAFDCHPEVARRATERAVDVGFFTAERRGGRLYVRQAARYPDWYSRLVGIENKPDLGTPGDLERQLRFDVSLALFDAVVLATESYVTRAHLNRVPDEVGVWRFDPERGEREVVREPTPLPVDEPGVERVADHPARTDVRVVDSDAKRRQRLRLAERAYGKGWRTYVDDWPACRSMTATDDGRPHCAHFERVVDPATECGAECPAFAPGDPPAVDAAALRAERTGWRKDPPGVARTQSGLDQFS